MSSMTLSRAYRNQDDVVLAPIFSELRTNRRLDRAPSPPEFRRRWDLVLGETRFHVLFCYLPELLLQSSHFRVPENDGGLIRGDPPLRDRPRRAPRPRLSRGILNP